jgi:hypothetical protein
MAAVITRVPSEVWLEIFNTHVWKNGDTPHRLLRVCHRWYSIALNAPSLWGNILYTNDISLAYKTRGIVSENRMRNKVLCKSVRELAKAIERTKSCSFELTTVIGPELDEFIRGEPCHRIRPGPPKGWGFQALQGP